MDNAIPLWYSLFNRLNEIREYDDFNSDFNKLLSKFQSNKEVDIDNEFEELLQRYWKRIFHDLINNVLEKIKKRKTRGELFKKEEINLRKILSKSEKKIELHEYENIYTELKELTQIIDDKLDKERFESKKFWSGLIVGFFLGIIASLIAAVILIVLKL